MLTRRRRFRVFLVSACVLAISPLASADTVPSGWVVHADRKQICQFATPPDWKADALTHSFWSSPDGKTSVVVSSAPGMSLSDAKGVMEGNFEPEKVFEDTSSRLWYEYKKGSTTNWYVGVAAKAGVCGATLSFKDPAAEPTLKQIANTVGAK